MFIPPNIDAFGWSGMTSKRKPAYQKGVREVIEEIGGFFIPSQSGYDGREDVLASILASGIKHVFLCGHSNGNKATTWIASKLKKHGVKCTILCFDCTMGSVDDLGPNIPDAMDLWAGPPMQRLTKGPDFMGSLQQMTWRDKSHIGMQKDEEVINIGRQFATNWRQRNPKHG